MSAKAIRLSYAPGQAVALDYGDWTLWRYHFATDQQKPHFFPITAPNGAELAGPSSGDDSGHDGLSFAWRSINGVVYPDDEADGGAPRGSLEFVGPEDVEAGPEQVLIITHYHYHDAADQVVMHDARIISITMPEEDSYFAMDWNLAFTPTVDVRIERVEEAGNGQSGLSWRMSGGVGRLTLHSSSGQLGESTQDQPARWLDLSGKAGRGRNGSGGVTLMVHPSSPRTPARWNATAQSGFGWLNPTPVMDAPLELAAGAVLRLKYRALVHDGTLSPEALEEHYQRYAREEL